MRIKTLSFLKALLFSSIVIGQNSYLLLLSKTFVINFQVHGALEIVLLSIIACGCGVKLKWQGAKFYFTHKRTLLKVRGFTLTIADINC